MSQARPRDEGPPAPEVRRRPRRHSEDREEGGRMARAPRTTHQGRTGNRSARRGSSASAAKAKRLKRIGIVDTSFSRYDMAAAAIDELRKQGGGFTVERYTVPGIKDLAAGARILFDRGCDLVMGLGMVGRQPGDKDCALAAEFGLQGVQAKLGRDILGGMGHEGERGDEVQQAPLLDPRDPEDC